LPVLPAIAIISGWSAELLVSRSFGLLRFSSGKTVAICLLCCALAHSCYTYGSKRVYHKSNADLSRLSISQRCLSER
jgi:hypothetical protein